MMNMRRIRNAKATILLWVAIALMTLAGCASPAATPSAGETAATETAVIASPTSEPVAVDVPKATLADGVYSAEFKTDSGMFHVNEANDGKGVLTVLDGKMTIHISMPSKKIVNLFPGTAEDAQKEGAAILNPTVDTVTYSDGTTEEVYGFDVVVPALDEEFALALIGTKGKWYDHMVSVSNPVLEK